MSVKQNYLKYNSRPRVQSIGRTDNKENPYGCEFLGERLVPLYSTDRKAGKQPPQSTY